MHPITLPRYGVLHAFNPGGGIASAMHTIFDFRIVVMRPSVVE
jgi:hypothetical protein